MMNNRNMIIPPLEILNSGYICNFIASDADYYATKNIISGRS